jgi:hypothetical protein
MATMLILFMIWELQGTKIGLNIDVIIFIMSTQGMGHSTLLCVLTALTATSYEYLNIFFYIFQ